MRNVSLYLFNWLTFGATLYYNYLYGSGTAGTRSVGEISNQYPTLITPAGFTFSIWGLIYVLLFGFLIYQGWNLLKKSPEKSLLPSGIWLGISNLLNLAWIVIWCNEWLYLSAIVIVGLLISLLVLGNRLKIGSKSNSISQYLWVATPIAVYIGWVTVATLVNISVLVYDSEILTSNPALWTLAMLAVASGIYLFLLFRQNLPQAAWVGVWAFTGIAASNWGGETMVAFGALALALALAMAIIVRFFLAKQLDKDLKTL
jgi:hypothetical protein